MNLGEDSQIQPDDDLAFPHFARRENLEKFASPSLLSSRTVPARSYPRKSLKKKKRESERKKICEEIRGMLEYSFQEILRAGDKEKNLSCNNTFSSHEELEQ